MRQTKTPSDRGTQGGACHVPMDMSPPPKVAIVHAKRDSVIPSSMGRKPAEKFPARATSHQIDGPGHQHMFSTRFDLIFSLSHLSEEE